MEVKSDSNVVKTIQWGVALVKGNALDIDIFTKNIEELKRENKKLNHECYEYEKALEVMRVQLQKALHSNNGDTCGECGCNEFLCGHNKRGYA